MMYCISRVMHHYWNFMPVDQNFSFSLPSGSSSLPFKSLALWIWQLDTSYEWNYAEAVFLCLSYFIVLKVHPCCHTMQDLFFFKRNSILLWLDHVFLISSSVNGILDYFFILAVMNSVIVNIGVLISLGDFDTNFFSCYLDVGLQDDIVVIF
jgi:hypothetical protein